VKRLMWARIFALIASCVVIATIFGSYYYYDIAIEFVQKNEKFFKLVALGIGPFLAVMGFIWGLVDKVELKVLAERLGNAQSDAKRAQEEADQARAEVDSKVARIKALEHDLKAVAGTGIWKLRKNVPFSEYRGWKYDPEGAKIVTIALFKGGGLASRTLLQTSRLM